MKKNYALTMYGLIMGLGFFYSGISQAKLDPMLNKNKAMFLKAVENRRWDDAQGLFALISGRIKEILDASPGLSVTLHNAVRNAVEADDLDDAKILMEWIVQLPPKRINVPSLSSTLQNRVRDAVGANDFEKAKKMMELVALLPGSINVLATSSLLENKVKAELKKLNFGNSKELMELVDLLPPGTNILAISSTLQNMLQEAVKANDSKAARMIATLMSYLPEDTKAIATIALLTHKLKDALNEKDATKIAFLAFVGERLPFNAKQEFLEKRLLVQLVRAISSALKDKNWNDLFMLSELFNTYKQHAASEAGKKTVENGEKHLRLAYRKAKDAGDMDAAEKLRALQ